MGDLLCKSHNRVRIIPTPLCWDKLQLISSPLPGRIPRASSHRGNGKLCGTAGL